MPWCPVITVNNNRYLRSLPSEISQIKETTGVHVQFNVIHRDRLYSRFSSSFHQTSIKFVILREFRLPVLLRSFEYEYFRFSFFRVVQESYTFLASSAKSQVVIVPFRFQNMSNAIQLSFS